MSSPVLRGNICYRKLPARRRCRAPEEISRELSAPMGSVARFLSRFKLLLLSKREKTRGVKDGLKDRVFQDLYILLWELFVLGNAVGVRRPLPPLSTYCTFCFLSFQSSPNSTVAPWAVIWPLCHGDVEEYDRGNKAKREDIPSQSVDRPIGTKF